MRISCPQAHTYRDLNAVAALASWKSNQVELGWEIEVWASLADKIKLRMLLSFSCENHQLVSNSFFLCFCNEIKILLSVFVITRNGCNALPILHIKCAKSESCSRNYGVLPIPPHGVRMCMHRALSVSSVNILMHPPKHACALDYY